jgi:hypothetical protein
VVFFALPELHDGAAVSKPAAAGSTKRSGPPPTEYGVCAAAYESAARRRADDGGAAAGGASRRSPPLAFGALPLEEQLRALVVTRVCRRMAEVAAASSAGSSGPPTPPPAAAPAAASAVSAAWAPPAAAPSTKAALQPTTPEGASSPLSGGPARSPGSPLPEDDAGAQQQPRQSTSTALHLNTGPIPATPPVAAVDLLPADGNDDGDDDGDGYGGTQSPESPPTPPDGAESEEGNGGGGNGGVAAEESAYEEGTSVLSASTADEGEEPSAYEDEEADSQAGGEGEGGGEDEDEDDRDVALETTLGRAAAMAELLEELVASAEALRSRAATEVVDAHRDRLEAEAERAYHEVWISVFVRVNTPPPPRPFASPRAPCAASLN